MTFKTGKPLDRQFYFLLSVLIFLTIFLRIGSATTEWAHGVPDWHPDAGRYFAQERSYISGEYKPVGSNSLYTGNPYANILFMSWIWRAANRIALYAGSKALPKDSFFLSKLERIFYVVLSLFLVIVLFVFAGFLFDSWFVGFWAAFFFAVSPLAIGLIHTIKPEIPLTFFITLAACLAYIATERRNFLFYVLFGFFAGLATATKYNGVVVLLYLLILHFWGLSEEGGISKKGVFIRGVFSLRLWAAFLLWALTFYATEPILWLSLKRGLRYIYGYSRIARFVGMPGNLYGHPLKILAYNIKQLPNNFILLVNCVDTFFAILALLPLIFTKGQTRKKAFKIALFPTILILSLFLSKSLFGEEYLLHPLPFVYILSGFGWYLVVKSVLKNVKKPIPKKSLACALSLPLVAYGLYIGFKEVRYFSYGNIRYYAKRWADSNLKGICIQTMKYAIPPTPKACKKGHRPSIIVVPSEKTFKGRIHLPPKVVKLKTIAIERDKPLLHHLRGHRITFYGRIGREFLKTPLIPNFPVPHIHVDEATITRFVNGIDFDPGYRIFALSPLKPYVFRMVTPQPLDKLTLILENTNVYNKVEVSVRERPLFLLPFEKKILQMKLPRLFPWTRPCLYQFSIYAEGDLLVKLNTPREDVFYEDGLNDIRDPLEIYISRKVEEQGRLPWPFKTKRFEDVFKEVFHYDYKLLKNLIFKNISVGFVEKIDVTTDFYKKKNPEDFCLFCKEPVLFEKGMYVCEADVKLCVKEKGKVDLKIITPSKVIKKKTITHDDIGGLSLAHECSYVYRIRLPFEVGALSLVHLMVEVEGNCDVEVRAIRYGTDVKRYFIKTFKEKVVNYILHHKKEDYSAFLKEKVSTGDDFDFARSFEISRYLDEKGEDEAALLWYENCLRKNPLCRICLKRVIEICRSRGLDEKVLHYEKVLKNRFSMLIVGPWEFETGIELKAVRAKSLVERGKSFRVKLYCKFPNISGDQAVQILLRHEKVIFGTCVSFLSSRPMHELCEIDTNVSTPLDIPPGDYELLVQFLIPKHGYKYQRTDKSKKSIEAVVRRIRVE